MKDMTLMQFIQIGASALFIGLVAMLALFIINPNTSEHPEKMIGTVQGWNGPVYLERNGQRELLDSPKYSAPYPLQSGDRIIVSPAGANPVKAEIIWDNGGQTILKVGTDVLVDDLERPEAATRSTSLTRFYQLWRTYGHF